MRSPKQIEASRRNGARSKGPVTDAGKRRSSQNSVRHNLLARSIVLEAESRPRFMALLQELTDEFQPSTASQRLLVELMAAARWRQMRTWALQKSVLDNGIAAQPGPADPDPLSAPAKAAIALAPGQPACPPELLLRYEDLFERQFQRAYMRLRQLEKPFPAKRTQEVLENKGSEEKE